MLFLRARIVILAIGFIATLAACRDESGTSVDGRVGTGLLDDGVYVAVTTGVVDDTCGTLVADAMFAAADAVVTGQGATGFTVTYPCCGVGYTCQVDGGGRVTCTGYVQPHALQTNATLTLDVAVQAFAVTSVTSYTQNEVIGVSCAGTECATAASQHATTFPCTFSLQERFAK